MRSGRPDASRPRLYLRRFGCSVAGSAGAAVSAAAARRRRRRWSCSRRSCRPPCRARRPRRSARWARDSPGHEMPPSAIRRNQTWARDSPGIPSEAAIRRNQTQSDAISTLLGDPLNQSDAIRRNQMQSRLSLVILSISRRTNFSSRVRTCCTRSAPTHARHPMLANA